MTYFAVNPQDANIQFDSESRVTSSCLPSCRETLWQLVEKSHELCPRPLLLSRFWTPWWGDPRRLPGGSIKCLSPCQCRQSLLVSCVLPTSMRTFCLSVAAHLCCDLTGEKKWQYFPPHFQFSLETAAVALNPGALNFFEETKQPKPQNNPGIHQVFSASQPEGKHSRWGVQIWVC